MTFNYDFVINDKVTDSGTRALAGCAKLMGSGRSCRHLDDRLITALHQDITGRVETYHKR